MYGAIISAVVNTGFDIYKQLSNNTASRMGVYASQLRDTAARYVRPFTNAGYWNLDMPGMAQQSIDFGLSQAPRVNQANMQQLQSLLGQALPGYQGMVSQATANTQSLLAGNVPTDVQQQIQRSAAFQTLQSGAFAGSAPTGAVTARDLGLTSLNLQQQGFTQMQGLIGTAKNYLMPQMVNPTSLLPLSDLITGSEWSKSSTFQANQAQYTALANALAAQFGAPQSSTGGGLGADASALVGALTKKDSSGNSALSGLFSMFGGSGGSGGGSSGSDGMSASTFSSMIG